MRTNEIEAMVEAAMRTVLPGSEGEALRPSFAYGDGLCGHELVTWQMVVEADEAIRARMAAS